MAYYNIVKRSRTDGTIRYRCMVGIKEGGKAGRTKKYVLNMLMDCEIANIYLSDLSENHVIDHCRYRRESIASPATINHDVSYPTSVLASAKPVYGINYTANPAYGSRSVLLEMGSIGKSNRRNKHPINDELDRLVEGKSHTKTASLFKESAMSDIDEDDEMTFGELIEIFLSNKHNMIKSEKLLSVQKNKELQRPAKPEALYSLEKTEKYFLRNYITKNLKLADGVYIFIISADDPYTILCAKSARDTNYHWHDTVDGHTSIGYRKPVRYAGTLSFSKGKLLVWSNASGHYKPPEELRYLMIPYVRRLLPDCKFHRTNFNK
ncbi:hypothetical protein [Xenorhabdus anantnagensis]|uniref:Uncharacterized protein n=1 Tax=Xenorhabdus anantnagensis TaxID=3025875 RepID=A0ABT5M098_9GAMM|nr:hypothetical protein [Xenorhabdus anantnagensis]MDC9598744.1 hypothetical protein [Xenorhabdus anantnagensis]